MISNDEIDTELKKKLFNVLGPVVATGKDFDWICQAILGALCMQYVSVPVLRAGGVIFTLILQFCPHLFFYYSQRTRTHEAHVRLPLCLVEPEYVSFLGTGYGAVRCLHRISFLARLNSIIEEATDRVVLGKTNAVNSCKSHHSFI
jgi:hypothetical protein